MTQEHKFVHLKIYLVLRSTAHKLEVTTLCGALGETVPLYHRLEAFSSAARWMATLESYMKTTVNTIMETCVQARLEEGRYPHDFYIIILTQL